MWDLIAFVDVALFHWNLEETRSCIRVICIQKRKRAFTESTFNRPCSAKHIFHFPHRSFISHANFLLTFQLKFLLFTCPIKNFHFPLHKFLFPLHKTLSFSLYLSHNLSHACAHTHARAHTHTSDKTLLAPTSKAQPAPVCRAESSTNEDEPNPTQRWCRWGRAQPSTPLLPYPLALFTVDPYPSTLSPSPQDPFSLSPLTTQIPIHFSSPYPYPYPFWFCLVSYLFDFLFWLLWNFGFGFGYLTLGYLFNFQFWFL